MTDKSAEKIVHDIINRFKELRIEQGLSHQKLADKVGLHRSAISLIESRKRQPTMLNCIKIADALGVTLQDLI